MALLQYLTSTYFFCAVLFFNYCETSPAWELGSELEDHISPEDLKMFLNVDENTDMGLGNRFGDDGEEVPEVVDCFGLGFIINKLPWLFNMKPDSSEKINTEFFFSSRNVPHRILLQSREQSYLDSVDFKPNRKTVVIIHGFMSYSNSSWVRDMTRAFIQWADVNVIAVDWSAGGNTWKYWKAVANTRRVGSDVAEFLQELSNKTGANIKDFHFIGHSLGAHITSFVSYQLGGVGRITGLDPAQPCFRTENLNERLDDTDADFVDVIHTNGRLLQKIGFGLPEQIGHADFYPNGGMRQPGCGNGTSPVWSKLVPLYDRLQQAICSHGRSYLLFTESLISNNCTFKAHRWNLTFEGLNLRDLTTCNRRSACAEMGIKAVGGGGSVRASGPYFALTTDKEPYCSNEPKTHYLSELLLDLKKGFRLDGDIKDEDMPSNAPTAHSTQQSWISKLAMKSVLPLFALKANRNI